MTNETRASGPLPLTASDTGPSTFAALIAAMVPLDDSARDGRCYIVANADQTGIASAYWTGGADGMWAYFVSMHGVTREQIDFDPHFYHPRHDGGPTTGA